MARFLPFAGRLHGFMMQWLALVCHVHFHVHAYATTASHAYAPRAMFIRKQERQHTMCAQAGFDQQRVIPYNWLPRSTRNDTPRVVVRELVVVEWRAVEVDLPSPAPPSSSKHIHAYYDRTSL